MRLYKRRPGADPKQRQQGQAAPTPWGQQQHWDPQLWGQQQQSQQQQPPRRRSSPNTIGRLCIFLLPALATVTFVVMCCRDRLGLMMTKGSASDGQAALRAQEARVYERTGSRFFQLPHCPDEPAYPPEVPILELIGNWNPDDVALPKCHHSTLCRIDYQADHATALRYRDAEVPFVLYNVPEFDETVRKWAQPNYLETQLEASKKLYPVEQSKSNHFLYTSMPQSERDKFKLATKIEPPLTRADWTYARWAEEAGRVARAKASGVPVREQAHAYLYVADDKNPRIREELSIFATPENDTSTTLFVPDPAGAKLIECRFGMGGIITEAHFDNRRNMAAVVSGMRRWILARPRHCRRAYLRPMGDLSDRQSRVDWAEPDLDKYPDFAELKATEVILSAGEILHVPSYWIHYVVVLDTGAQCNAHCGRSVAGRDDIEACGFRTGPSRPSLGAGREGGAGATKNKQ